MLGGSSLDHLIRPAQQRVRDPQAEGLHRLEIDHQVELRGLLDGEIARLGALENLAHIGARPSGQLGQASGLGHEATRLDVLP